MRFSSEQRKAGDHNADDKEKGEEIISLTLRGNRSRVFLPGKKKKGEKNRMSSPKNSQVVKS
jgi:hypothetical protein